MDNEQPLLRRRTTVVRRQDMERANMQIQQRQALKPNLKSLVLSISFFTYYTAIWYLCTYVAVKNPDCNVDFAYQMAIATWTITGLDIVIRLYVQCKYRQARFIGNPAQEIQTIHTLQMLFTCLGFTIFFIWSQCAVWPESSIECADTSYAMTFFSYVNYIMYIVMIGFPALSFSLLCCCCLCLSPFIYAAIQEESRNREAQEGQNQENAQNVIDGLVKKLYDPNQFTASKECAICFVEFNEDDMLTPLPCDPRHYFHSECIEHWMKEKTECPLCRTVINTEALAAYSEQVDAIIQQNSFGANQVQRQDSFGSDASFKSVQDKA